RRRFLDAEGGPDDFWARWTPGGPPPADSLVRAPPSRYRSAGDVVINGLVVGHANVALQIHQKRVRVRDPSTGRFSTETITVTQAPVGILRIAGKSDIRLDWGLGA